MIFKSNRRYNNQFNKFKVLKTYLVNIAILFLRIVILGFIWSFSNNFFNDNKIKFNTESDLSKLLVISDFEKATGHKIKVEILNGCGSKGIADKYTNLFRKKGFDVIYSGNANNFNYDHTHTILRDGEIDYAIEIAKILEINPERIYEKLDPLRDCDATIIIGKDFEDLKSFNEALRYSPPF